MKPVSFNYADYKALQALSQKQQEANDKLFQENEELKKTLKSAIATLCCGCEKGSCDDCYWKEILT